MQGRALTIAFIVSLCALPAAAQLQSKHQIRCLRELWKAGAQVSQAQGQDNVSCAKSSTKEQLSGMTAQDCLTADMKQRVAKKQTRAIAIATTKCSVETPTYGSTDPETVSSVSSSSQVDLVTDLFGPDVEEALVACSEDRDACNCQVKTLKAAVALSVVQLKEFAGCTKRAIKVNKSPFLGGVLSTSELERCLSDDTVAWSVASDERSKVAGASAKLADVVVDKCGGVSHFPGSCTGQSGAGLASCIVDRVDCRTCLAVNEMYALGVDCDSHDDGAVNSSCQ